MTQLDSLSYPLVLLAGGLSSRTRAELGLPKGLLPFNGSTWIEAQLESFRRCGGQRAIVVLGYRHEEYLDKIPTDRNGLAIQIAINPTPERGPFTSLQRGLESLATQAPGAFLLPLDVPCPHIQVWKKLEHASHAQKGIQVCKPIYQERGGHPVLLSRSLIEKLLKLNPESSDARLDAQIRALRGDELCEIDVEDAQVLLNLNTSEAWKQWKFDSTHSASFDSSINS